jgi:hypothetical protein
MATIKIVPGFAASTSGFHFANSFPSVPLLTINVLGQNIPIGDASNGLCGGMVFAVRDFFESKIPIWPDTTAPSSGTLYDYIVNRLFDSFDLLLPPPPPPPPFITLAPPFGPGPATYMWLMDPALPDHETIASNAFLAPHGRAWIMIMEEWPKIQADIDNGVLSPIGLLEIKSSDPTLMGKNHQVLAYGYKLNGTDLDIHVYDPNHPDDDTVKLSLSLANPQQTMAVTYSTGETILCFFRTFYAFSSPPPHLLHQRQPALSRPRYTARTRSRCRPCAISGTNTCWRAGRDAHLWLPMRRHLRPWRQSLPGAGYFGG